MNHPFLTNGKTIGFYFLAWIVISTIHAIILYIGIDIPLILIISDAIISNFMYAIIAIGLWYSIKYLKKENQLLSDLFLHHAIAILVAVFIWFVTAFMILFLIYRFVINVSFLNETIFWRILGGIFYFAIITIIYYVVMYYNNLQEKIKTEAKLSSLVKEAELKALRSQINPHFLFNSLNSISSLTISNPTKAQTMTIKLSEFLRYSLKQGDKKITTLEDEIYHINLYLDIEKVRFNQRLNYTFSIEENITNMFLPVMILQPLFENAIKHGVYNTSEQVNIEMIAINKENSLQIIIKNNFDKTYTHKKGTGTGIRNVSERLFLIYGMKNLMEINKTDEIFQITLTIPQTQIYT